MTRWQLAVLDMAGTTVRDDGVVEAAFVDAIGELGVVPGTPAFDDMLAVVRATMGQSKIEVFRRLLGDDGFAERANAAFEEAYAVRVRSGAVAALPAAAATIASLRRDGIRVALSTGFAQRTQDEIVDALGWRALVDGLVCPGPGVRGRPYPDMILVAAARFGVADLARVVVAGDTPSDIAAGLSAEAGLVAGVLTGAGGRDELAHAGASAVIHSIADLPGLLG